MTAPEALTDAELANAQYRLNYGAGFAEWKSFNTYKDGDRYIQLWFVLTPESLEAFKAANQNVTMVYEFDWNGQGDKNQTITFSVVPGDGIVLRKGGEQIYPVLNPAG